MLGPGPLFRLIGPWGQGPRCYGVLCGADMRSYEQSMSMSLTSSISMCVLGEAVDNGVDCFLEDGLGPRVGHRTRHWPTARGNGGCGLRLRPRHVRRHADTTHSLSIQRKHTAHQHTNYYPVNGTNTRETHKTIPFCLHEFSERAGKSEKHARYGRRDVCVSCLLLCSRMDELSLRPDRWRPA